MADDRSTHDSDRRIPEIRDRDGAWRSLEEWADTPEFRERLNREFPAGAAELNEPVARRRFLQLAGASLALAGVTGCTRQPKELITPYVRQPEEIVPGKPLFYATAMTLGGVATGILAESHEGRPTKIEGNPEHPASAGATDVFAQAAVLGLYDPDRSQTVTYRGEIRPWSAFLAAMPSVLTAQRALEGAGLRILTGSVTSPTLAAQIRAILAEFPRARWHQWEPLHRDTVRAGARMAYGEVLTTRYRFSRADVILSLDADFLGGGPGHLRYVKEFTARRRLADGGKSVNRLYAVEATPTLTGARADHRLPLRPSEIEPLARAVATRLGVRHRGPANGAAGHEAWVEAVAADLEHHPGRSLVIAGDGQPAEVHALAHAMNEMLGNVGETVTLTDPIEAEPVDQTASLRELVDDMSGGRVDVLFIAGGNPVYDAPADLEFGRHLSNVEMRVHLSLYDDETSERCHWHIPATHFLEEWSDARTFDGTVSLVQPLIAPLYDGRSVHEFLAALTERPERRGHDIVRDYWQDRRPPGGSESFELFWRRSLHDGMIQGTAFEPRSVRMRDDWDPGPGSTAVGDEGLEVVFRADPCVHDGRFANNGWLQELPKPLSKLTWDNAVLISPATAERLGVGRRFAFRGGEHGEAFADLVELEHAGRKVVAPVWLSPGHPDEAVTLHLGYGRTRVGRMGDGAGFSAYALRESHSPWYGRGARLQSTGETFSLANTQGHWNMEGRDLARGGTLADYREQPDLAPAHAHHGPPLSMFPDREYKGYAWGMTIDLNACTGCGACVVACQAENNIPVVGKEQVLAGREMHWIRVDRYHSGDPAHPESIGTRFQPVPCMQCENAPCEVVCPVAATVHSAEGLNDMVYNRCVGTRYCANNCPYKVRRFNYHLYQDWESPSLRLLRNPDVSVRSRGVMEKCTYCVQRINRAKIQSELEDRPVRDGEIATACQAACPARAIDFGNVNDPDSRVARLKQDPRNYSLIPEVNTRPRTTYLGTVSNPNTELTPAGPSDSRADHDS